jgi:HSP20 family protein
MTVLTRWDPFREFNTLQDRMNRLFRDNYGDGREEALATSTFAPPVDVYEDEHNVVLKRSRFRGSMRKTSMSASRTTL